MNKQAYVMMAADLSRGFLAKTMGTDQLLKLLRRNLAFGSSMLSQPFFSENQNVNTLYCGLVIISTSTEAPDIFDPSIHSSGETRRLSAQLCRHVWVFFWI